MPFDSKPDHPNRELVLLRTTRALIATPAQWIKGRAYNYGSAWGTPDSFCVLGAISYAAGWRPERGLRPLLYDSELGHRLTRRMSRLAGGFISAFNDCPETTHADIMDLFNRVEAELLAEEETVHAV